MGLLSRLGRGAGAMAERAGDQWKWNAPLGNAAIGAVPGAMMGASTDQENPLRGALVGGAIGAGGMGGLQAARAMGSGLRAGGEEMALAAAEEAFKRRLSAFPPRTQQIAQALKPVVDAKGGADWSDLEQFGNVTPDELRDLSIIFSRGHDVSMVGHPSGGGMR